jgi:hypothetical protein
LTFDLQPMSLIAFGPLGIARPPMDQSQAAFDTSHFRHSSLREKLLEHVFIGELLQCLWGQGRRDIEVLRAEIDYSGYDLVLGCNGVLRFVQFKSSHREATTRNVNISLDLSNKQGACVVWIIFDPVTMKLGPFLWFGGGAGKPLPPLGNRVARHAKADKSGVKAKRPNLRVVGRGAFTPLKAIEDVVEKLFGPFRDSPVPAEGGL